MSLPKYHELMLPLLQLASDQQTHNLRAVHDQLARQFGLTDPELRALLPSGKQSIFLNRVGWAKTYLTKAGLLQSAGRGQFNITPRGQQVLSQAPTAITPQFLKQFDEFLAFHKDPHQIKPEQALEAPQPETVAEDITPEEQLEMIVDRLKNQLAEQLLEQVKRCSPFFFEQLVVDLLVAMGYGGTHLDAGRALQKSHDEGIDGIIKEDRLGLDVIYVQAKRWEGTVGRPQVQAFAGSLEGFRARKGILLTTSDFSKQALEYVQRIEKKIILIDGQMLTRLMIECNIGVSEEAQYTLKKIDMDYFEQI